MNLEEAKLILRGKSSKNVTMDILKDPREDKGEERSFEEIFREQKQEPLRIKNTIVEIKNSLQIPPVY
jgi:hypothetical protein